MKFFIFTLFTFAWLMPSLAQNRNVISVPDFSIANSQKVVLPIEMDNTSDVVAVQFTLEVPSGISINTGSAKLNASRRVDHNIIFRSIGGNKYMCMINSTRNKVIPGNEGNLITIELTKTSSNTTFICPITLTGVVMATSDGTNVLTESHSGTLTFKTLESQAICSGSDSEAEDFYQLSSLFDYNWTISDEPAYIEGYTEKGKSAIFPMTLTNEGIGTDTLKYNVDVKYGDFSVYSFVYDIIVRPVMMGAFFNFSPRDKDVVASNAVQLSWNNIINAVYDVYLWKVGENRPSTPIVSGLSNTQYNASTHCTQGESYNWCVVAHNYCQEIVSDINTFAVRDLPDLHVTQVNCSDPVAGQNMTIEWTVKNDGIGSTADASWYDYIWLIPDMKLGTATTGSKLLKKVENIKALDAGESYNNRQEVKLDERTYGNYNILVTSDMYNVTDIDWPTDEPVYPFNPSSTGYIPASTTSSMATISEITNNGKKDNFFYSKIDIAVPPLPDLQIPEIKVFNNSSPVSEIYGGTVVDVVVTIENKGESAIKDKTVRNVLYLSGAAYHGDAVLTQLASSYKTLNLDPGASCEEHYTVTVPLRYHGDLYFHAQTDVNDEVFELANIANNWGVSDKINVIVAPCADFQPTLITTKATDITANQTITVTYTVENMGAGKPDANNWTDRIYLCKNADGLGDISSNILLASVPISYSENKYSKDVNVKLPSLTDTYYIYIVTDANDTVFEYEGENNNTKRTEQPITFVLPDLTVELNKIYTDTIKSNKEVSFEWKIKNVGTGDLQDVRVTDKFYASSSESGTDARLLGTISNNLWIAAGSEKVLRGSFTVPYGTANDANQYIFIKTDVENMVTEADETNNVSNKITRRCKFTQAPVYSTPHADLAITNATAPTEAKTSSYLTANWTCANLGNAAADAFNTAIYLSEDALWSSDDVRIFSSRVNSLAIGGTTDIQADFYLSDDYATKKYFIFVADYDKAISEIDKDNNTSSLAVTITKATSTPKHPDIAITFAKAPQTITTTDYVTVNWTCANIGKADVGSFTSGIYLSDDEIWDSQDILLATQRTTNIKQDGKADYQTHLCIADQNIGQKFLIFRADKDNVLDEDTKANNCKPIAVTIVKGTQVEKDPGADLSITSVSASSGNTIASSTDFVLNWTCTNIGSANASSSMVGIYLSEDNSLSTDDVLMATQFIAMLNQGTHIDYQTTLHIPDLYVGHRNIIVCADIDNTVNELSEVNNSKALSIDVTKNGTTDRSDLTAMAMSVSSSATATTDFNTSWKVTNIGSLDAGAFMCAVYLSDDASWSKNDIMLASKITRSLTANNDATYDFTINVSEQHTGNKYLIFCADINSSITEITKENNYVVRSMTINPSPTTLKYADLTIQTATLPEEITTSEEITVKWTTKNNGTADAGRFVSAVYLSTDETYSNDDIVLASERTSSLKTGETTDIETVLSIADKYNGNKYLIFRADAYNDVSERETSNNFKAMPVTIACAPLPDLKVKSLISEKEFTAGQEIKVTATIINTGEVATRQTRWVTEYYLSANATFNKNNAARIGSSSHSGILKPDEEYTESVTLTLPQDISGNYLLFAYVDATDAVFESNKNNNVSKGCIAQIYPVEERPVDLSIAKLEAPVFVTAGQNITIAYKILNNGQFAATGTLRDVIYLSRDNNWDRDDIQVGVVTGHVDIEAGGDILREATGRIVNVPEGMYYFIVKTNSTRSIPEVSEADNTAVSHSTSEVRFKPLSLGQFESVNTCGYYKIDVASTSSSQTVGFNLTHPEETTAGLYVSYESVPSTAKYDFASFALSTQEQSVILPVANMGCYYVLAQDNSSLVNNDGFAFSLDGGSEFNSADMTLTASQVNFGATSLSIKEGGTDGWISTKIKGALFDSIMDFRLAAEEKMIPAERIVFHDQTSSSVTFNLRNAEVGLYDVVTELPNGTLATLPHGFHIVSGVQSELGIKIDAPRVVHVGSHSPVSITIANGGTNDIQIKEILVKSNGSYLGKKVSDFKNASNELHLVPEDYEADRFGYISIAPGTQKVINFFMEQHLGTSHMNIYIIK